MPFIVRSGVRLHYQLEGKQGAPALVLSNSLGANLSMWAPQMPALYEHFSVVRYDSRGHGQSQVPPGPYSIDQLGEDVLALLDTLEIERTHFCGISLGGQVGMWLASHHPNRINRLVLANTGARIGNDESWNARIAKVESEGVAGIASSVLDRWLTEDFQRHAQRQTEILRQMLCNASAVGYAASSAAVRDADLREAIGRITAPTLILAGKHDLATPPEDSRFMASVIHNTESVELNAAHFSNWESAQNFNHHLLRFLLQPEGHLASE